MVNFQSASYSKACPGLEQIIYLQNTVCRGENIPLGTSTRGGLGLAGSLRFGRSRPLPSRVPPVSRPCPARVPPVSRLPVSDAAGVPRSLSALPALGHTGTAAAAERISPLGPADPTAAPRGSAQPPECVSPARAMVLPDLHSAAASADLALLRQRWWLNKLRINAYNRDKQTPLHLACINGHADVVQFLVEKKCKLNPRDKLNKSPLMKAVEHQHRDCAAILLEHGANPNHKGVSGNTALHLAVMVSSKSLVELLLEHGADIEAKNKLGYTPLALAITEKCEEMVEFLLQKGADVNAQDNVFRTPLQIATVSGNKKATKLLLQHGAVFSVSDKGQNSTKGVQDDVIAKKQIGSSCYETTPIIPVETSSLGESEEAAEKEDSGPIADRNKVFAQIITEQTYTDYKAEGPKKKEDKCRLWNPEPNREVLDKAAAPVRRPPGMFPEPSVAKGSIKGTWKAAGAAKEDNGSLCNRKHLSGLIDKVINTVQRPVGKLSRVGTRSAAKERGKGVLQPSGGAAEDTDSSLDSETDPKSQGRVWTSVWLSAANGNRLDARSAAVGRGKGVSSAASVEAEKEDGDPSWGSEAFSDIAEEVFAGKRRPAADRKAVGVRSAAMERIKGVLRQVCRERMKEKRVLQPAREEAKDEDNDSSLWDSEADSKGEGNMSAAFQLPAANTNRLNACSAAAERIKEVLKQAGREGMKDKRVLRRAGREVKDEDNDSSPWDSETDSVREQKISAAVQLPAAKSNRLDAGSAEVECGKGALKQACREGMKEERILQPAGGEAKDEDYDSAWDSETDSEGEGEISAAVQLPAANSNRLDTGSAEVECDKEVFKQACRDGMKEEKILQPAGGEAKDEDYDSPWDSETDSEGEGEMSAAVQLSAAKSNRLDAGSAAVECGKGALKQACREGMKDKRVLQPAVGEAKDEDNDSSPWDSETDSEGEGKMSAAVHLPPANSNRLDAGSAAVECGKGALKQACTEGMKENGVLQSARGEAKDEDKDSSPWDSETDSEGEGKISAAVHLPPANSNRLDAGSAAVECSKGALKQACREGMKDKRVLQPAVGEAKDEDNDSSPWDSETDSEGGGKISAAVQLPPANSKRLDAGSAAVECGKGALKQACTEGMKDKRVLQPAVGEAKDEDNDSSPWDSETDSDGAGKISAAVHLPPANSNRLNAGSAAVECSKGVLKQACGERMKDKRVLQPAGGEAKDEDKDSSPWDSETDSEGGGKISAAVQLPPANSKRLNAGSAAGECGKGALKQACREGMKGKRVLQPAGGEAKDEDKDSSPWDSETDSEGEGKMSAAVHLPPANSNRLDAGSAAVECSKGVLKQACREGKKEGRVLQPARGEAKDEDKDSSPWDSETDFEGEEKMSAAVHLPVAKSNRLDAGSAAVECGKGVLKQACREGMKEGRVLQPAGGEAKDEDYDTSPWDSETDFEGEEKMSAAVQLPAAKSRRLNARSAAGEHITGALTQVCGEGRKEDGLFQPAGGEAKDEDYDSPWDSETDSEGEGKMSANVHVPAAHQKRMGMSSAAVEHIKAVGAEQEEHFISSSENKLPALQEEQLQLKVDSSTQTDSARDKQGEDLQLKLDSSTQTDSAQDKQGEDLQLKVDSSTQTDSAQDKQGEDLQLKLDSSTQTDSARDKQGEDLQLKLDSSTQTVSAQDKQLKYLKEPIYKYDYDAVMKSLEEKKVLTIVKNMQSRLAVLIESSAAAIPQLEERIRRLQIQSARLEATIEQQAKTIEALERMKQVSYRSKLHRAFPVRDTQSLIHDSSVDAGFDTIKNCLE
ncbi:ankyrin repeat domain-containing protein 30A-like [Oenanthe melanoleuca]|uniref:ankyrin repeat domain-containing protein 30A-like n=1 Tax=Oenanthe melanoleuca TaxID=2939378 RepID=UPI0024C201B6|nr:ankyrin repeat domain-containing protein 30A-like [Oenanthe melanoleuca]